VRNPNRHGHVATCGCRPTARRGVDEGTERWSVGVLGAVSQKPSRWADQAMKTPGHMKTPAGGVRGSSVATCPRGVRNALRRFDLEGSASSSSVIGRRAQHNAPGCSHKKSLPSPELPGLSKESGTLHRLRFRRKVFALSRSGSSESPGTHQPRRTFGWMPRLTWGPREVFGGAKRGRNFVG
jgi:hypothetical protein